MKTKVWAMGLLLLGARLDATQLLVNGSFATGDLTGWMFSDSGGLGDFSVTDLIFTPDTFNATVGAASPSTYYAVSDDFGPQTEDLIQPFTVPSGTASLLLSYSMFVNDVNGSTFGSSGPGGSVLLLNSTGTLVVATLQAATDTFESSPGIPNGYVTVTNLNIIGDVTPGSTYELEFQETDQTDIINVGVDNVSLVASATTGTPEPGTFIPTLVVAGLFLLQAAGYKRSS